MNPIQSTAAMVYHVHHFGCAECQAAGRMQQGARRCEVGAPLWHEYMQSVVASASGEAARAGISEAARSGASLSSTLPDGNHGKNDFSTVTGRI